jgi:outer membrane protein OmpU
MNNLKKIGLSALAGSLSMFSVSNADITLGGSAEITYTQDDGTTSTTGNPYGMSHTITFTGTGELDVGNGIGYTVYSEMAGQDMVADSSYMQFDAGDLGKFGIDQGVGQYGIGTIALSIPTAYEEADHAVGVLADGLDVTGDTGTLGYMNTISGVSINVEYNPASGNATVSQAGGNTGDGATGQNWNVAVKYSVPGADGLELRAGLSNTDKISTAGSAGTAGAGSEDSEMTAAAIYSYDRFKAGYQMSDIQNGTAGSNGEMVMAWGVSMLVNDDFSVSYAVNENEADVPSGANVTEESTGIMAAYTMGSASLRVAFNEADNVNGVAGVTDENLEISLSLSF